ncbi:uncharacterized protein EI97DRAFT_445167 [Westerdykella ornata]|uniref:Heterokaryon incompatibility domain-containing protein n=1 Tax=Westerdykella ornata TaxID=318751 RepID=A0A6A6J908_WESOR|nr:uncharacterized protein EI97DRAFT_445167 [Westerdykella ornata]KAF2273061.1 hypothetical protein EI97DRAFT_445167 [Westerdykella ornata]
MDSELICGSMFPLVRRRELHTWNFPLNGQCLRRNAAARVAIWKKRKSDKSSKLWIQSCYSDEAPLGTKLPLTVRKRYSGGTHTPMDREIAAQAIVQAISGTQPLTGHGYGLWEAHLLSDLLWYIGDFRTTAPQMSYPVPTWSWLAVDGKVGSRQAVRSDEIRGSASRVITTAQLVLDNPSPLSGLQLEYLLTLRCPVLRGVEVTRTSVVTGYWIFIVTQFEKAKTVFRPGTTDVDTSELMFCAELVRGVFFARTDKKERTEAWSNGIVLRRFDLGRMDRPVYKESAGFGCSGP